jgi:hypothetical protein
MPSAEHALKIAVREKDVVQRVDRDSVSSVSKRLLHGKSVSQGTLERDREAAGGLITNGCTGSNDGRDDLLE